NGLSHNAITGITQDSTGYIWISTGSGINRYNGSRFVQFHSTADSLSLASEVVSGITWLCRYQLAAYTNGVHIINTRTGATHNIFIPYHNKQYQYKFNMIQRAMGDEDGNIYVLTRSGFYHYNKNNELVSRFDYYSDASIPYTHIFFGRHLVELDERRLLIVSIGGLYIYEKDKKKVKKMEAGDCPPMDGLLNYPEVYYTFLQVKPGHLFALKAKSDSLTYIDVARNRKVVSRIPVDTSIHEFNYRTMLLRVNDTSFYITGHISGFYEFRLNPASGAVTMLPEKHFAAYLCNTLFRDRDGHLWVATNKGVFRQNPQRSVVQVANIPDGMENLYPNIMLDDVCVTDDKVYVGTRNKGGLLVYDKKTLTFRDHVFFTKYETRGNTIYATKKINPTTLLLGTDGPLLLLDRNSKKEIKLNPPKYHPADWVYDIHHDRRGRFWIGAYFIHRYDPIEKTFKVIPNHGLLHSTPFAISEDTSGNIWLAGHGLARYNIQKDTIDLLLDSFPYIKMPDKQVSAMTIDRSNNVWFNSNNNGLIAYNIATKKFRQFTRNDGLPDDNIASLIIIRDHLWIACLSGIACLDLRTSRIVSFGKEDGFPDMPILKGARFDYDSAAQQLYLGFSTAIVRFNPLQMLRKKSPPHVFVENLTISGHPARFLPGSAISTSWKENDIRITIGTINFYDGQTQRFAYRIVKDGFSPWVQMGSQPSMSISSLPPGTHRIQLKAFSPNNRWAEQVKELSIVVRPPFWQTYWFIALMGVLAIVLIYLLIKWRTGLVRKKEMVKTHIEKLKADDYKSQFELEQISNYFSSSLADKKTEDEVLWDVAQNLIGHMNYVDCIIYLWNKDKTKMVQKAAYGPKGKPEVISKHVFEVLPGQGIVGHVIETMQPVLLHDTRTDKRYRVDDAFRLSEVCVPIIHNGELMGAIDSEHYLPNYFTERDI
ncbi:MAG TPA: two-component regulator propeller domain-containing protein, partial [Chitinophagaceae bacterium]|nr:two-component regulator propeller domain-containing protein [Chitinophagaceae bacterium]